MASTSWCSKCGVRVGMSSNEHGSVTFKGKVDGVTMNHALELCGRCVKKIYTSLKDRNTIQRKAKSAEKIVILSRETNATAKKVEKQAIV